MEQSIVWHSCRNNEVLFTNTRLWPALVMLQVSFHCFRDIVCIQEWFRSLAHSTAPCRSTRDSVSPWSNRSSSTHIKPKQFPQRLSALFKVTVNISLRHSLTHSLTHTHSLTQTHTHTHKNQSQTYTEKLSLSHTHTNTHTHTKHTRALYKDKKSQT